MPTTRKHLLAAAVASGVLAASLSAPAEAAPAPGFQQRLDELRDAGIIGVQGRVVTETGRRWTAASGAGDLGSGRPVPRDGRYRIGSNTKTFVATVVLQLVGEGRLSLDDSVERWLPGVVRGNGHDGRRVTVRQLLQHTSGLRDYLEVMPGTWDEIRFRHFEPEELVALALKHPPQFAPGTDWSYSNTGYALAGMIIKRVTGRAWGAEVERRIIRPLGLRGTSVPVRDPRVPWPSARSYHQWELGGAPSDVTEYSPSQYGAAGAMISTTADLSAFFRALLGGRLIAPRLLAEMKRTRALDQGVNLGYGLGIYRKRLSCGREYWAHGGLTMGYISAEGFTADGSRGVALSISGATARTPQDRERLPKMVDKVVDDALCGRTATP
ncbi:serine hydrolase domain-containing protein [Spirillospora sp. CA-294931]|uniref:serine hydrolase domain-containing protein n=1 Tax=Spirillospora sp. CA-294931 TaxID=3240042 RepID=UPI003D8C61B6